MPRRQEVAVPISADELDRTLEGLTPDERRRFELLTAKAARIKNGALSESKSFREFVDFVTSGRFIWYRFTVVLANVLQQVADGLLKRVLIFAPPRHGKSESVSRLFPAYYLYRHPERWVGLASYADRLATSLARNARDNYVLGVGAVGIKGHINRWETGKGGGMWSAGIGGSIVGLGAHLLLIDDPIKNAEHASSLTRRERDRDWYVSTFSTRAEPDAAIVIIMTRWDIDDLAGWLLDRERAAAQAPEEQEHWHIVNFEALKESAAETARRAAELGGSEWPSTCTIEPDWRQDGEALAPERYSRATLLRIKARIGEYFFEALYQQRPRYKRGQRFTLDMLQIVSDFVRGGATRLVRWWDRASTEGGGDRTSGALVARDQFGVYYVVDVVYGQWGDLQRDRIIRAVAEQDRLEYGDSVVIWGEQEPGSAGKDMGKYLKRLLEGFTVRTETTTGSKDSYVDPLASTAQAGNLKFVAGSWNAVTRREFLDYPGRYDDIVESVARAASKLALRRDLDELPPSVSALSYS